MTLYKYVGSARKDILENNLIRYTPATELNDPFEMSPVINDLAPEGMSPAAMLELLDQQLDEEIGPFVPVRQQENIRAELHRRLQDEEDAMRRNLETSLRIFARRLSRQITEQFLAQRESIGVLSLSETCDNLLMWSHYAENHAGFVIALNEQHPSLNGRRADTDEFFHPRQVAYQEQRFTGALEGLGATEWLLTKSPDWAYEREWRVLKPIQFAIPPEEAPIPISGLFDLPADAVEEIYMGARVSEPTRRELLSLVHDEPRYQHCKVYQAELHANQFALTFRPIPSPIVTAGLPEQFQLQVRSDKATTEEDAETFGHLVATIGRLEDFYPLEISCLTNLFIVDDVSAAVENDLGQGDRVKNSGYFVLGVPAGESEGIKLALYLPRGWVEACLDEARENRKQDLHRIRRALAHAYDVRVRHEMFGQGFFEREPTGLRAYLTPYVHRIWTRFFIGYATLETVGDFDRVRELVQLEAMHANVRSKIQGAIADYRPRGDERALLMSALSIAGELFDSLAEYLGLLHAVGEVAPPQARNVENEAPGFRDTVDDLLKVFSNMHRYYPAWNDPDVFEPLYEIVEWYLFLTGIGVQAIGDDGVYVAVP